LASIYKMMTIESGYMAQRTTNNTCANGQNAR
jgi:hypothetical protein